MIDERGVTVPINYLLVLGVMTLLSAGLLVSTSAFVEDQQEQSIRTELQIIGGRVAADIAAVDRLAGTVEGAGSVGTEIDLPGQVAGSTYRIEIASTADPDVYRIALTSTSPDVSVSVPVRSQLPLAPAGLDGDDLVVSYTNDPTDGDEEPLEVANA